jgi:hypothetical protein
VAVELFYVVGEQNHARLTRHVVLEAVPHELFL